MGPHGKRTVLILVEDERVPAYADASGSIFVYDESTDQYTEQRGLSAAQINYVRAKATN